MKKQLFYLVLGISTCLGSGSIMQAESSWQKKIEGALNKAKEEAGKVGQKVKGKVISTYCKYFDAGQDPDVQELCQYTVCSLGRALDTLLKPLPSEFTKKIAKSCACACEKDHPKAFAALSKRLK